MKVFPYLLFRVGGLSYDELLKLNIDPQIIEIYFTINEEWGELNQKLREVFSLTIKNETDLVLKKQLRKFRKRLFKDKVIEEELDTFLVKFDEDLQGKIIYFEAFRAIYKSSYPLFAREFKIKFLAQRKYLQELSSHPHLQNGLIFSAPNILARIAKYQTQEPKKFRKKAFQTERAVMRYLARITTKTSPFSTFNQIGAIRLSDSDTVFEAGKSEGIQSHLRLNNYLFSYLKNLIFTHSSTRTQLKLVLNSTLEKKGNEYVFLTNSNNIEAFQHLENHPVIELIVGFLQENKLAVFQTIIEYLETIIDAKSDELETYVFQLFEIGLLEFDIGVSGMQADWHSHFIDFLKKLPYQNDLILDMQKMLVELNHDIKNYPNYSTFTRLKTIENALENVANHFEKHQIKTDQSNQGIFKKHLLTDFNFTTSNLFYEDSSIKLSAKMSKKAVDNFAQKLQKLRAYLANIHGQSKSEEAVLDFFKLKYLPTDRISLLQFYQDYTIWKVEQRTEKEEDQQLNMIKNWQKALGHVIQSKINSNEIRLTYDEIEQQSIRSNTEIQEFSAAVFVQFFKNKNGALQGFINASLPGFGKYFSRFLHLIDKEIAEELRLENAIAKDIIHAEISDASYFNANIHPVLMPFEITTPNGNNKQSTNQQIPVNELFIHLKEGNLELFHASSQRQVLTYDLGFQSMEGRSELFKLLNTFSPARFVPLHYISNAINAEWPKNIGIQTYPRIVYEEAIIIQRKTWLISISELPRAPFNKEKEVDYFIYIQEWMRNIGLPKACFYTIHPKELSDGIKHRATDNYKPQYCHFDNPIMVQIFGRDMSKVNTKLKIEEMLPASDGLFHWNEKPYITECLLQWNIEKRTN